MSNDRKIAEVITRAKEDGVRFVDLKFIDLPGVWQHLTVPVSELNEDLFVDGHGFDGSSIRGFRSIESSDMVLVPDAETAVVDPFIDVPTLSLLCDVRDPVTGLAYDRDPRGVARRAEAFLQRTGAGDTAYFGPEAEFFVFDDVRAEQTVNGGFYRVDSDEGSWNSGREEAPNLGYKPRLKGGYFPVAPVDSHHGLRDEMCLKMEEVGIQVETHHHEVATGGQGEIDMRFDTMLRMADKLMWFKYIVKNVARAYGKSATFMPKPLYGDNGSGMHTHMSLWRGGRPTFAGELYGGLSQNALYYIGGILKHAPALCALTNPTTNSYRRLVPGYEAPNKLAYSSRNRSAAVRIPMYSSSPKARRLEYRTPDPSCNPYLAFAAMLMAGLDGIENQIDPGQPLDKNIYNLPPEELSKVQSAPGSLDEALAALQSDHSFLLKGDVFTEDLLSAWIDLKHTDEIAPSRLRPTPFEFLTYFDC
ncbi:type I glutamate--ammonia ligase [Myxococcota bacterium]|nr:type I glutamate--ammonia ligase [Myxococcota bacterium]